MNTMQNIKITLLTLKDMSHLKFAQHSHFMHSGVAIRDILNNFRFENFQIYIKIVKYPTDNLSLFSLLKWIQGPIQARSEGLKIQLYGTLISIALQTNWFHMTYF